MSPHSKLIGAVALVTILIGWGCSSGNAQGVDAQSEDVEWVMYGPFLPSTPEEKVLEGCALVSGDLDDSSKVDLWLLRQTVYARHGQEFVDPDALNHFTDQTWYVQDTLYTDDRLTSQDHRNVEMILRREGLDEEAETQQVLVIAHEVEDMSRVAGKLEVLNAYLTDKIAVDGGDAPDGFEQPPLGYYKENAIKTPLTSGPQDDD